jgi:outer membrane protein OmpA-like peptidoglycan-associated protein
METGLMLSRIALGVVAAFVSFAPAFADATIPNKDIPNARDNPLLKRYEGSFIVSYDRQAFTEFKVPLTNLVKIEGDRRDRANNYLAQPTKELELEGARTRIAYFIPADRSPLEVLRNYEDVVKAGGGEIVFQCKGDACGGDPTRSSAGGGGEQSLMMYFVTEGQLKEPAFSNGACALTPAIEDQRFFAAKIPQAGGDAYVTVQTYQINNDLYCKAFNSRTVALVHVLEPKPRDQKMVVVKADEMTKAINASGRIALYGIFFDTDKADVKIESNPTLNEISTMLAADPRLAILIVGHTDNQGAYDYNLDLSRRRAESVVRILTTAFKVDPKRLRPAGVGMLAPATTNDAEDGRARNRRVEVVKLN